MTSRSCLPAKAAVSVLLIVLGAAGTAKLCGQGSPPAPSPSATPKPKQAFLRFWNLLPKTSTDVYELVPAADPKGKTFQSASAANYGATYNPVPPGRYVLNLCRGDDHEKTLKSFDFALQDKDYASIVVHPGADSAAPPEAELTMDMPDPQLPLDNRLTVRQCLVDGKVLVAVNRIQTPETLSFGASYVFKDLPKGPVPVGLSISINGRRPERLTTEADFTYVHRTTLLIVRDAYGRLRPRVVPDGPNGAPEETPAPTPTPGPAKTSPTATAAASPTPSKR